MIPMTSYGMTYSFGFNQVQVLGFWEYWRTSQPRISASDNILLYTAWPCVFFLT